MDESAHPVPLKAVNKARLEFLFDGVFAIAMTILVLELKVPELADRHARGELFTQLAHHGRTFLSYILSFAVLGGLWYNHHILFRCLTRISGLVYVLHIVLMGVAAFIPFCASLLGQYPGNSATYTVYFGSLIIYQTTVGSIWLLAKKQGHIQPNLDQVELKKYKRSLWGGLTMLVVLAVVYSFIQF